MNKQICKLIHKLHDIVSLIFAGKGNEIQDDKNVYNEHS